LQYSDKLTNEKGTWKINGQPIEPSSTYRVVMNDFLLTGGEANLEYLKQGNPDITRIYDAITTKGHPQADIRIAVIKYMLGNK
jgi:2',3'-cyclic-nucleotide 2'-phosphodiesterase (5'-nucleotidase family)